MLMVQFFYKKYKFCNRNDFIFLFFPVLKSIKQNAKSQGLVCWKWVKLALCGMECINLNNDVIKIWICYSHDKTLGNEKNFLNLIIKLQNVLNMRRMKNLSLLGKISIFKTLAFSKIIHLTLVTSVPSSTIDILTKIQKNFLWDKENANVYVKTLNSIQI